MESKNSYQNSREINHLKNQRKRYNFKEVADMLDDDKKEQGNFSGEKKNFEIHPREDNPKPVLEEFFMISSKSFLRRDLFPPVRIDRKTVWEIKTDTYNYRVNDAWAKKETKVKGVNNLFFYFRLSGLNMYYTNTNSDYNVLGVISVKSMDRITEPKMDAHGEYITTCFELTDVDRIHYKICGLKEKTVKHWYCQIKAFLGESNDEICKSLEEGNAIIHEVHITKPIVMVPLASPHCNEKWNYQKFGEDWECDCKEGHAQSPIDLPKYEDSIQTDVKPLFRYKKVKAPDQDATIDGKNLII